MTDASATRMLPTDRIDYSAIIDRPALKLLGGARMAIWVIVNVEEWDPRGHAAHGADAAGRRACAVPDIPNWCWHEYGPTGRLLALHQGVR